MNQPLTFTVLPEGRRLTIERPRVVVAGYTGADPAAVQHHIDELAAIGVPPPPTVPAYYPMPAHLATQDEAITVPGPGSSGEVEPVLLRVGGALYLAVGSDHTDRDLERESIARSKEACPKPLSRDVVEVPAGGLDWPSITMRSTVDGRPYQDGSLAALRPPTDVLRAWTRHVSDPTGDLVLFGGTLPLLTGEFTPGQRWTLALEVPGVGVLEHGYTVRHSPHETI